MSNQVVDSTTVYVGWGVTKPQGLPVEIWRNDRSGQHEPFVLEMLWEPPGQYTNTIPAPAAGERVNLITDVAAQPFDDDDDNLIWRNGWTKRAEVFRPERDPPAAPVEPGMDPYMAMAEEHAKKHRMPGDFETLSFVLAGVGIMFYIFVIVVGLVELTNHLIRWLTNG